MSTFTGTSGDDTLTGTSGDDFFNVYQGGNDTVSGLAGNDVFNFAAAFTAADTVNGGTGSDTLELKGDYSAGLTFGATTLTSVEQIKLADGFSYELTPNDANVAAGATMTINAANLTGDNTLFFDGSHETNGTYRVVGGAGDDTVSMGGALTAADRIDGGGGNDTVFLGGNYSFGFTTQTIRNIADLVLFGGFNYHFVTNDANIAAGATMQVDAGNVGAGHSLVFSAAAETDGNINYIGGAGLMELAGGSGSDTFFMGANLAPTDRLNGNGGSDVVFIGGGNYDIALQKSTLQNIENLKLGQGFNYHITTGGGIGTNDTLVVDATSLSASNTLYFNASKETAGSVIVDGGAAPATIIGTQQGDAFDFAVTSQGGFNSADTIDGQAGYDILYFDGDYTGAHAVTLTNSQVINVEEFVVNAGHSYDITIAAGTAETGGGLEVNGGELTSDDSLTFDGSAASSTRPLDIIGGAGNDTLTGGNAADTFDLAQNGDDNALGGAGNDLFAMGAALTATDHIDGGTGSDQVYIDGYYMGGTTLAMTATTMVNVEVLTLGNTDPSFCYDISTADATVAAGKQLEIDGSSLTSSQSLTFDGSAETDGHFLIIGGADADNLTGGALSDIFAYSTSIGVTGALRDTINAFDFANDKIAFETVTAIATALNAGTVNAATIDANLTSLLTAARLPAHDAILFTPNAGNLAGHTFLIVDGNGTAGYQTGQDLVIELSGALHTANISTANFVGGI